MGRTAPSRTGKDQKAGTAHHLRTSAALGLIAHEWQAYRNEAPLRLTDRYSGEEVLARALVVQSGPVRSDEPATCRSTMREAERVPGFPFAIFNHGSAKTTGGSKVAEKRINEVSFDGEGEKQDVQ